MTKDIYLNVELKHTVECILWRILPPWSQAKVEKHPEIMTDRGQETAEEQKLRKTKISLVMQSWVWGFFKSKYNLQGILHLHPYL